MLGGGTPVAHRATAPQLPRSTNPQDGQPWATGHCDVIEIPATPAEQDTRVANWEYLTPGEPVTLVRIGASRAQSAVQASFLRATYDHVLQQWQGIFLVGAVADSRYLSRSWHVYRRRPEPASQSS